ncbi:hypothetical protein NBRC116188_11890 [Oceaniserpentilla sp. 4NH20-0058]|uniref:Ig-like domain-containing protein n=1 Tax=Oceaniserpentilla sp. 4NH20-0058 TaxID=3127660 RepID=UPI003106AEB3
MAWLFTVLSITLLISSQAFSAACPSSSSAETTGASDGSNCTVTDGTTGTVIQLNFITGFDSTTLIENDTAAPTATDTYFTNNGVDPVRQPSDVATDAATQSKASGNNGTTVGAQRKLAFIKAAEILAAQITTTEPILVDADFTTLACSAGGATLGSASSSSFIQNASAPAGAVNSTWYPVGLYNSLDGADNYPSGGPLNANPNTVDNGGNINDDSDVFARYNSSTGNTNCLDSSNGWYYGFDAPPSEVYTSPGGGYFVDGNGDPLQTTYIGFTTVLLHEMLHGLGFSTVTDSSGNELGGLNDIYATFLRDNANNRNWSDASESATDRYNSSISSTGLLWTGSNVNTAAVGVVTAGYQDNDSSSSFTSGDRVQMYAPNPFNSGSSVSHFDTAVSPNEIMEPQYTAGSLDLGLAIYLLKDIGWTINVGSNSAPVMTAVDQSTNEDTALTIDASSWATDANSDTLTYSVSSSCATNITCSIDTDGTSFVMTPAANHNGGTHSITINVSDGNGGTDSDTFNLNVVAQNDPPAITAVDQSTNEDTAKVVDASGWATDVDGDTLTYSVSSSCATNITCSINTDGTNLTMTPAANHNGGTHTITINVSDGNGGTDSDTFNLNVIAQNDPPAITAVDQSTNEDTAKVVDASGWASDIDGGTLVYSVNTNCTANITCSINSDGTNLTMTPAANHNGGTHTITIFVNDSNGGGDNDTFNLNVVAQNDAPAWSSISDTTVNYSTPVDIDLSSYASDVDGDSLTYTDTACGSGLNCSISSNTLTLTASSNAGNTVVVTIQADDSNGGQTSVSFNVNITDTNSTPVLGSIGNQTAPINVPVVVNLSATDADSSDTLTYSKTSDADGVATVSGSALTLSSSAIGSFSVTVQVSDGNGGVDNETFTFDTYAEPSISLDSAELSTGGSDPIANSATIIDTSNLGSTYSYALEFEGANASNLLDNAADSLTIEMPTSGQFAGEYVLTFTDSNTGETYDFTFVRAPRLLLSATQLLANQAVQTLTIEGGAAGESFTLISSETNLSFIVGDSDSTTTVATNDSNHFNKAEAILAVSNVTASTSVTIDVSSIYEPISSSGVTLEPARTHNINIEDTAGNALAEAILVLDTTNLGSYNIDSDYLANSNGAISLVLPQDTTDYPATVSLSGYSDNSITLAPSNLTQTVILDEIINPMRLTGEISATGNLSFASELPEVTITLDDGSEVSLTVTQVSDTVAEFDHTHNLALGSVTQLSVSHSQGIGVIFNINTSGNLNFEIFLDSSTQTITNEPTKVGSSGGTLGYWLAVLVLFSLRRSKDINHR